jgi:glycosyltransferase involved in cell wall biosynthesis
MKLRILFLSSGTRVPSARFRIHPVATYLSRMGHSCTVRASFPQKYDFFPWLGFRPSQMLKRFVRRLNLWEASFRSFDILYIDREIFDDPTTTFETKFHQRIPCLVLDLDDAVFLRYPEKFERLVPMSDLLVAGNSFLRARFAAVHPAIVTMPTCIDLDVYRLDLRSKTDGPPIVGWMGTTTNVSFIHNAAAALRKLATMCSFELRIIAGEDTLLKELDLSGVNVRFLPWNPRTEVEEIARFDIGIMPLREDEWSKYKCGLKLLQYMALGIPGVASPVGVNSEIIQSGTNGYLASDDETWIQGLHSLVTDPVRRQSMGELARKTVEERYSLDANVPRLATALIEAHRRVTERPVGPNSQIR